MAKMIDVDYYKMNLKILNDAGIANEDILPITYINSSAEVKAEVGQDGRICVYKLKRLQDNKQRTGKR